MNILHPFETVVETSGCLYFRWGIESLSRGGSERCRISQPSPVPSLGGFGTYPCEVAPFAPFSMDVWNQTPKLETWSIHSFSVLGHDPFHRAERPEAA